MHLIVDGARSRSKAKILGADLTMSLSSLAIISLFMGVTMLRRAFLEIFTLWICQKVVSSLSGSLITIFAQESR